MFRNLLFNIRQSFRIWMRNRIRPVTVEEAEEKKLFWSKIYMMSGILLFLYVTERILQDPSRADYSVSLPVFSRLINNLDSKENIRVIKYSGFTKVSDTVMTKKDVMEIRDSDLETLKRDSKEIK